MLNLKSMLMSKNINKKNRTENKRKNWNVPLSSLPKFKYLIGKIIIPPTSNTLAILLPIKLPATIPSDFNFKAWNVAANSGREVPKAIIKIPINISLILNIFEKEIEFLIA